MIQENGNSEENTPELEIILSPDRFGEKDRSTNDLTVDSGRGGSGDSDPEEQTTERNINRILKPIHDTLRPIGDTLRPIGDAVVTPVAIAVDHLIPKIGKIPWYHFIVLSIIVSVP